MQRRTRTRAATVALALLLVGCNFDLPSADRGSVDVFHYENGTSRVVSGTLSLTQISALADWFSRHESGWEYSTADLIPGVVVLLKRDSVKVAGINIGASFIRVNSWYRMLTSDEHAELMTIVDPLGILTNPLTGPTPSFVTSPARPETPAVGVAAHLWCGNRLGTSQNCRYSFGQRATCRKPFIALPSQRQREG